MSLEDFFQDALNDKARIRELERQIADYKEADKDKYRLVRDLDVLLNGAGAAKQASLCDIVSQVASEGLRSRYFTEQSPAEPT